MGFSEFRIYLCYRFKVRVRVEIRVRENTFKYVFGQTSIRAIVLLVCLYDQNKSGFFGGPAFFQPIRAV